VGAECSYALKGEEMNFSLVWRPRSGVTYVVVKRMAKLLWYLG